MSHTDNVTPAKTLDKAALDRPGRRPGSTGRILGASGADLLRADPGRVHGRRVRAAGGRRLRPLVRQPGLVAVFVTVSRVFPDSLAGYALAKLQFRGRTALFAFVIAVMAVPAVVLLIPKFLVLNTLGMYDSYQGMVVPLLVDAAGVFIMKQFFESIPVSVEEAARIDGAGTFRIFWSVVLPMARPALITLTILSFQGSWNELPHFIVSRQDPDLHTLTSGVASLVSGGLGSGNQYPLTLAAGLLMTIPVALVFFFFQRYFVRGAGEGAVKG